MTKPVNAGARGCTGRGRSGARWGYQRRRSAGGATNFAPRLIGTGVALLLVSCAGLLRFGWGAEQAPPEASVRQVMAEILARPEYHPPRESPFSRLMAALGRVVGRVLEWLLKPLEWLVDRLSEIGGEGAPVSRWMVIGLLLAMAFLLLAHIYYMAARAVRPRRRAVQALRRSGAADPQALWQQARRAADTGDYRRAVRLLYLSALMHLDRAGLIDYHPSRTNWSYAEALSDASSLAEPFRALTSIADRVLYAGAPATDRVFARAAELYQLVEAGSP